MAEANFTPPGEFQANAETPNPGQERLRRVARPIARDQWKTTFIQPDGTVRPPEKGNKAEEALHSWYLVSKATPQKPVQMENVDEGNPYVMPAFDVEDRHLGKGEAQIIAMKGMGADGLIHCAFKDKIGNVFEARVPKASVEDAVLASGLDDILTLLPDGTQKDALTAYGSTLTQRQLLTGQPALPLPSDEVMANLEAQYPPLVDEEADLNLPPLEQLSATLREQAVALEDQLKNPEKELTAQEQQELLQLLGSVRLAQELNGGVGVTFQIGALQQLYARYEKQNDTQGMQEIGNLISSLNNDGDQAQSRLHELAANGGATEKDFTRWKELAQKPGGMMEVLKDKSFINIVTKNPELCKELVGKDMDGKELKELFKGIKLSRELQELLDSGDETSILKILLMIAAGLVAAPALGLTAAGIGTGMAIPGIAADMTKG